MSYLDLSTYDILDLIPSATFTDEMKGEFLKQFVVAYGGYLTHCLGSQFQEEDSEELDILLSDEDATAEEVESFFKERIPDFDDFLTSVALKFKKDYLLEFYQMMAKSMKQSHHFSTPLWDEIISLASNDEWDAVFSKIKEMETKDQELARKSLINPPPSISSSPSSLPA